MIVKIRTNDTNGWIYLDKVRKTEVSRDWALVIDEESGLREVRLKKIGYLSEATTRDGIGAAPRRPKGIPQMGTLTIKSGVVKPYDFDVDGNLPTSTNESIYSILVLELEYENGSHETYIMRNNNDVFIVNEHGKTIERI